MSFRDVGGPKQSFRSTNVSKTGNVQETNKTTGKLGGLNVKTGGATHRPSTASRAGQALKSFFSSLGERLVSGFNSLKTAMSSAFSRLKANTGTAETTQVGTTTPVGTEPQRELSPSEMREKLSGKLPPGVTVGDDGSISGQVQTSSFPETSKLADGRGKSFGETILDSFTKQTTTKIIPPKTEGGKPTIIEVPKYGDISICHQAANDFYRMDLTFDFGDHQFNSLNDIDDDDQTARNTKVATALNDLTGDKTATLTLSSCLTQSVSRMFTDGLTDKSGNGQGFNPVSPGKGVQQFREPNGDLTDAKPRSIGAMKMHVSQDINGDFKVVGSWDYLTSGTAGSSMGRTDPFDGMDGAVMKSHGTLEMTISKHDAENGNLVFLSDPQVTMQFTGQMAPKYSGADL